MKRYRARGGPTTASIFSKLLFEAFPQGVCTYGQARELYLRACDELGREHPAGQAGTRDALVSMGAIFDRATNGHGHWPSTAKGTGIFFGPARDEAIRLFNVPDGRSVPGPRPVEGIPARADVEPGPTRDRPRIEAISEEHEDYDPADDGGDDDTM